MLEVNGQFYEPREGWSIDVSEELEASIQNTQDAQTKALAEHDLDEVERLEEILRTECIRGIQRFYRDVPREELELQDRAFLLGIVKSIGNTFRRDLENQRIQAPYN